MTHLCRACDGTGALDRRFWRHHGLDITANLCGACAGSGRVEERIPASDALADAETLRRFDAGQRNTEARVEIEVGVAVHLWKRARYWITMARDWTGRGHYYYELFEDRRKHAEEYAHDAARAAFRAVPWLRG